MRVYVQVRACVHERERGKEGERNARKVKKEGERERGTERQPTVLLTHGCFDADLTHVPKFQSLSCKETTVNFFQFVC